MPLIVETSALCFARLEPFPDLRDARSMKIPQKALGPTAEPTHGSSTHKS